MECSRAKYDSVLLNKIGYHVCQTIIFIHEQQPELLVEKYRNIPWNSVRNQSNLNAKLFKVLGETSDWHTLLKQVKKLLKALLIPESFESPILVTLLAKINLLNPDKDKSTSSASINSSKYKLEDNCDRDYHDADDYPSLISISDSISGDSSGIAILLLDVENLQIDPETENFLNKISSYPLKLKIAFANWCAMGKKDYEFHQRGYDLIHVPAGKDNADAKMIACGVSLQDHYSQVKAVFVGSGDRVINSLYNHLQKNGINVYHVTQKGHKIEVLNVHNQKIEIHQTIPSIEKLLSHIKEIISAEEVRTAEHWFKLSRISKLFYKSYNIEINRVITHHYPQKDLKDILVADTGLVLHEIPEDNEVYISLFKISHNYKHQLKTKYDLEKALVKIFNRLVTKTAKDYIPTEALSGRFQRQYGQPVSKVIEKLDLDADFIGFLHSCHTFILEQRGDRWQVSLRQNS